MKQKYVFEETQFVRSTSEELIQRKARIEQMKENENSFRIFIKPNFSELRKKISRATEEERKKKNERKIKVIEPVKTKFIK
jgi:hypothetical protein